MNLEDRKKKLQADFDALEGEKKKLVDQGKVIQQRLNEIGVQQTRLQGSYSEVEFLMSEPKELTVVPDVVN